MARSGSVHFDGGRARLSPCLFSWKYFGILGHKSPQKNQFSYFKNLSRVLEKNISQTFNRFFEEKTIQKSKFKIHCKIRSYFIQKKIKLLKKEIYF